MNTDFAEILMKIQPFKYKEIYCWFSHVKLTKSADYVISKSRKVASASHTVLSKYPNSICSHAIELPKKEKLKNCINPKKEISLAFVGRFSKVKNIDKIIDLAFYLYNKKIISDIKIMAQDHEFDVKENAIAKLNKLKIPFKMISNNKILKIYDFLESNDILISISEELGINKVMLEAAAVGIPVITNSALFYDYFKMYKGLYIDEIDNAEKIAKIFSIWNDLPLNQKLIKSKAAIKISKKFTTVNLIREILFT